MKTSCRLGFVAIASIGMLTSGCATGWFRDARSKECVDAEPGSPGWWKHQAQVPPGARQKYSRGKYWPPYPRHQGERAQLSTQFHATHYWPHPYNCQDQAIVGEYINRQTAAGWQEATTIYHYYFDAETNKLTNAGERKLLWILRHVPEQYRTAYVQADRSSDVSNARLTDVKNKAVEFSGGDQSLVVRLRQSDPFGRPAEELSRFRTLELDSMPSPRIPLDLNTSSAGGSGGDSGSGSGTGN